MGYYACQQGIRILETNPQDPMLKKFYLAVLVIFLMGYVMQFLWLKKQKKT